MPKFVKVSVRILLGLVSFIILAAIAIFMFTNFAPQFGAPPSGAHLKRISQSNLYQGDQFVNPFAFSMDMDFSKGMSAMYANLTAKNTAPPGPLPAQFNLSPHSKVDSFAYITWFGHSAILLEMEGKRILIDPMLGPHASPVSFFGGRFPYQHAIPLDTLSNIDAVIISHDHYDHLDYPSILSLKDKVGHFLTPLGVGSHLMHWGVPEAKITELDWWEEAELENITFVATPSKHFSGRGLNDRNKTLWSSWVIRGEHNNIFFSGDGGYFEGFKEIGEKYGPFDFTMMECGQYNERWADVHMIPEQTAQANLDLGGKIIMPIHWGAFKLAMHSWTDPVDRLYEAIQGTEVVMATPTIGQRFAVQEVVPQERWWKGPSMLATKP
jgi:L-ascorbate metabolism protein UlaG (beta-lactamase superfamily)